jgi:hypothetical protein
MGMVKEIIVISGIYLVGIIFGFVFNIHSMINSQLTNIVILLLITWIFMSTAIIVVDVHVNKHRV